MTTPRVEDAADGAAGLRSELGVGRAGSVVGTFWAAAVSVTMAPAVSVEAAAGAGVVGA
jgi:hypothetical protein